MNYALEPDSRLSATLGALSTGARAEIEHAGAYALSVMVRRHVNRYARTHHASADALGASPPRHLEDGSAAITCRDSSVQIPIPGFNRVFHPVTLVPKRAKALTIPISRIAYGVRASRLESEGWELASAGGILYGTKDGGESVPLYALKAKVRIRQDRTMLPTDQEMRRQTADAVARAIMRRTA